MDHIIFVCGLKAKNARAEFCCTAISAQKRMGHQQSLLHFSVAAAGSTGLKLMAEDQHAPPFCFGSSLLSAIKKLGMRDGTNGAT